MALVLWSMENPFAGSSQAECPGAKVGQEEHCPSRELTGPELAAVVQPPSKVRGRGVARGGTSTYDAAECNSADAIFRYGRLS